MKSRKQVHCEGIDLGDALVIEEADEKEYKHLRILERDDICQEKMKEKLQKEYYKRAKAVLKSKLNGGKVINANNIWAVAMFRYGIGIICWNKGELDKIDRQTRKLLNMHKSLHPRSSVDMLCIPRAQGVSKTVMNWKDLMLQTRTRDF